MAFSEGTHTHTHTHTHTDRRGKKWIKKVPYSGEGKGEWNKREKDLVVA